ncbi:type IV secretion system DNA-binding domain-containing protein, partial [bacterium]
MENLKTFSVFLIASVLFSFGIWNYWMFSSYEISTTEMFIQVLANAFSASPLTRLAIKSIILGTLLGCVATYLYLKFPPLRFKTKGFIRGAEMFSPASLSKITRAPEEESQITIAGVPIPPELECLHFLIGGSTGAGKSVAINEMLSKIIPRGDRVIITDPNGEFLSRFRVEGDVLLNPFDRRGQGWSLYNEIRSSYDHERYSKSVIPPGSTAQDAEWHAYAQLLFSETAKRLLDDGKHDMRSLSEWLTRKPAEELKDLLIGTAAAGLFEPGAGKALASTRFIVTNYLAPHQYLSPGKFSLRNWLEDRNGGNLFVTWREDMADALRPLISTWLDIISTSILSLTPNPKTRIWLIVDELASLEKLNSLEAALTKGRKHGLRVVAGLQSTAQLDRLYGKDEAVVLRSCFRNLLILGGASSDPDTAEVFSRGLGEWDVERKQESVSRSRQGTNRTKTTQRVKERVVLPSEIMNLPKLTGYLSLAGDFPLAK